MMKIVFAKNLFCDQDGIPLVFNVETCVEKESIVSIILRGGGRVEETVSDDTVYLAPREFMGYKKKGVTYLAIDYITASCKKNKLLPYQRYMLTSNYKYSSSFHEDLKNLVDFVKKDDQGITSTVPSMISVTKKRKKLTTEDVTPDSSDEEFFKMGSAGTLQVQNDSKLSFRQPYSMKECQTIVNFIISKKYYSHLKGNAMWKKMERRNICPGRTWQSLKEHFRKKILPWIHRYTSDKDAIRTFRNTDKKPWKKAQKCFLLEDEVDDEADIAGVSNDINLNSNRESSTSAVLVNQAVPEDEEIQLLSSNEYVERSAKKSTKYAQEMVPSNDEMAIATSSNNKNQNSKTLASTSALPGDHAIQEHEEIQFIKSTSYVDECTEKITNNAEVSKGNATVSCDVKSKLLISNSNRVMVGMSMDSENNSATNHDKHPRKKMRTNDNTSVTELGNDIETQMARMFEEQSVDDNFIDNHDFQTLKWRVLHCYIQCVWPSLERLHQELVSGVCPVCSCLVVYEDLEFEDEEKRIALCKHCFVQNESEVCLKFIFFVVFRLKTRNGKTFYLTLAGNDGRDFFGCTEKEYMECANMQSLIHDKLATFLRKRNKPSRLEGNFTRSNRHAGVPSQIFLSNCSLDQTLDHS